MIGTLRAILEQSWQQLSATAISYLPPLLAAVVILFVAWLVAVLVRALFLRLATTTWLDRFLAESGLSSIFGTTRPFRTAPVVGAVIYWLILLAGLLMGLNAFNTSITSRMVETIVFLLPKLALASLILLVGVWIGHYLARSALIWAVNENLPYPRRLAAGIRVFVIFAAVVAAADHLNFARTVFVMAFLLVVGGVVLAGGIALGLTLHKTLERRWVEKSQTAPQEERSLWDHL